MGCFAWGAAKARAGLGKGGRLARDQRGQGTVEYILLLSVTVGFAVFFGRTVIKSIDTGILKLGGQLEKDLKTGRAPINVWRN